MKGGLFLPFTSPSMFRCIDFELKYCRSSVSSEWMNAEGRKSTLKPELVRAVPIRDSWKSLDLWLISSFVPSFSLKYLLSLLFPPLDTLLDSLLYLLSPKCNMRVLWQLLTCLYLCMFCVFVLFYNLDSKLAEDLVSCNLFKVLCKAIKR